MGAFCCFGATGILSIVPVEVGMEATPLNCPAWDVPNLVRLWMEAAERGENMALAGVAAGRRGNPRRLDVAEFDLPFAITGSVDAAGTPWPDEWVGLMNNLDTLWTNVFAPVTTGRGTRVATLTMPSGAVRTAAVQVEPLHFPNDIDDPGFVEAVIHLTVVSGRFA